MPLGQRGVEFEITASLGRRLRVEGRFLVGLVPAQPQAGVQPQGRAATGFCACQWPPSRAPQANTPPPALFGAAGSCAPIGTRSSPSRISDKRRGACGCASRCEPNSTGPKARSRSWMPDFDAGAPSRRRSGAERSAWSRFRHSRTPTRAVHSRDETNGRASALEQREMVFEVDRDAGSAETRCRVRRRAPRPDWRLAVGCRRLRSRGSCSKLRPTVSPGYAGPGSGRCRVAGRDGRPGGACRPAGPRAASAARGPDRRRHQATFPNLAAVVLPSIALVLLAGFGLQHLADRAARQRRHHDDDAAGIL